MRVVQITDTHVPADPSDPTVVGWLAGIELHDPVTTLRLRARRHRGARDEARCDRGDRRPGRPRAPRELPPPQRVAQRARHPHLRHPRQPRPRRRARPSSSRRLRRARHAGAKQAAGPSPSPAPATPSGARSARRRSSRSRRRSSAERTSRSFLWQHHPPVSLVPGYLPDNDFLIEDDSVLVNRHDVRGIAVGHVHSDHDAEFGGMPLHATPSTFMGAPGPGYRIFDFTVNGFTHRGPRVRRRSWHWVRHRARCCAPSPPRRRRRAARRCTVARGAEQPRAPPPRCTSGVTQQMKPEASALVLKPC